MGEKLATMATTASTLKMAQLVGFSRQHFERIAATGVAKPLKPDCWPIIETFQSFLRYARDESRNRTKTASQNRVQAARAREIELRTAQRAGELCEVEEALAVCDEVFGGLRADLSGLPATVTRDLSIRNEIETALDSILNKRSRQLEERAKTLTRTASQVPQSNGRDLDGQELEATRV
jgi:hypothetical protein